MRLCLWCRADLTGRRRHARYCSVRCRTYDVRKRLHDKRVTEGRFRRPRCMICNRPLPYGKPGFNFKARACSPECHVKLNNWFVRKAA